MSGDQHLTPTEREVLTLVSQNRVTRKGATYTVHGDMALTGVVTVPRRQAALVRLEQRGLIAVPGGGALPLTVVLTESGQDALEAAR